MYSLRAQLPLGPLLRKEIAGDKCCLEIGKFWAPRGRPTRGETADRRIRNAQNSHHTEACRASGGSQTDFLQERRRQYGKEGC
jgi:hypothetical protein